jgi:D-3-phosphoglycerate dehydrogenase
VTVPKLVLATSPFVDADAVIALAQGRSIEIVPAVLETPAQAESATVDADGVLVVTHALSREVIEAFSPTVRVIARAGVGLDAIDLEAARARGIAVFHTPDYCVEEVATHTLAMALALSRRLPEANRIAREEWGNWRKLSPLAPLSEQTVGVLGLGRIGQAVAELMGAVFGNVIAFDPYADAAPGDVRLVADSDTLLRESDVVTLHLPLTDETRSLISTPQLTSMKSSAVLVNVSRGGLIDEHALALALVDGSIAGAALDVLTSEPPEAGSPLLAAPNVLLSPHMAWYSTGSEQRVWTMTVDGSAAYLAGQVPAVGRLAVQI